MTPEEQRIAIAEACGWKPEVRRAEIPEADFLHVETFWTRDGETRRGPWLPDYLNSLDEMHEAVMAQTEEFRRRYREHLCVVTLGSGGPVDATAAQRAEAFLKALGRWQ